jgi:hypothetical protein
LLGLVQSMPAFWITTLLMCTRPTRELNTRRGSCSVGQGSMGGGWLKVTAMVSHGGG